MVVKKTLSKQSIDAKRARLYLEVTGLAFTLVSLIHILLCLALILIVLLQTGKGSDLASAFGGGGSQTLFGGGGGATFLNKITTIAAIFFMVTSLSLAILSSRAEDSMLPDAAPPMSDTLPAGAAPDDGGTIPEAPLSLPAAPDSPPVAPDSGAALPDPAANAGAPVSAESAAAPTGAGE
ncbi:preprotein translocase subunit SecG [bacterium]|nr:preprotein translocase subunit SecG [candidate division CSSED10-310 bacterium]